MKIQPIDESKDDAVFSNQSEQPASKSRLRRLFDRPFKRENDGAPSTLEPSSLCLDKMVWNFIEDANNNNDRAVKHGKSRCNCFNGNGNDSSEDDDEFDVFFDSATENSDCLDTLKSLVSCESVVERNLLADISKVVEKNAKTCKRKDDLRKIVTESLTALCYDASICASKWKKSASVPAGEYEYIDVIIDGERLIIDVDFLSEFEIARSTSSYRQILKYLPSIYVGKPDRLRQIVSIASEAARQSLKKKGMHIPPWRKAEHMKSKWLGPYTRRATTPSPSSSSEAETYSELSDNKGPSLNEGVGKEEIGELDLIFGEGKEKTTPLGKTEEVTWQLPAVKGKGLKRVVVTGLLASQLKENM